MSIEHPEVESQKIHIPFTVRAPKLELEKKYLLNWAKWKEHYDPKKSDVLIADFDNIEEATELYNQLKDRNITAGKNWGILV